MLDVLAQHCREVAGPGDQEMVEALPAQGADEAFGDRVGSRRSDRCPEHLGIDGGVDGVERGGELGVAIADEESEASAGVVEVHEQVAGLLGDPGAGGVRGDPGDVDAAAAVLDGHEHVEAAQEDRVDVREVEARMVWACAARNWRQVGPDRCSAGSIPAAFKIFHTVEAATGWPSPISSPWMRRQPNLGFSLAIRSTDARTSCAMGGRPGRRG
jgi:hypothetical protein